MYKRQNLSYTSIIRNDLSVLDSLEANFRAYVDEVNASIVADKESRAAEEASKDAVVESEGLKVSWEFIRYDADGMDFQGAMAVSYTHLHSIHNVTILLIFQKMTKRRVL